jgi:hypothetical protein
MHVLATKTKKNIAAVSASSSNNFSAPDMNSEKGKWRGSRTHFPEGL